MRFSIISISQTTFLSNYIQKSSYLLFLRYLYYFLYNYISIYSSSIRKYLIITILQQPLVYLSLNLVRIPKSSSYSSLFNYFTLGVPTLGLLVTYLIGFLSLSSIFLSLGIYYRFCYYIIQLLNLYIYISSYLSLAPTLVYLGVPYSLVLGSNLAYLGTSIILILS